MQKLTSPFDLIKKAINIFAKKENIIFLVKIYVPVGVFSAISLAQTFLPASIRNSNSPWLFVGVGILQILYFLTSVFVTVSGIIALGKIVGGGELSAKKTFKSAWKNYWIFLLLSIVLTLIYLLGFVFLIIPGILFVVWFAFSRFMAIEKGFRIKQSLLKSKELVKGMYWKILGRLLVFGAFTFIVQMILSIAPYGVGSIISSLCGGLYLLPLYLLYKELSV
ncbi:MAG: hypothetical protein NT162_01590 [Candidatus Woesebacteria bacterium]|nr:hypothetical protein [Candidatus Woesebacteria bacterium]